MIRHCSHSSLIHCLTWLTLWHAAAPAKSADLGSYQWFEVTPSSSWAPRAGLEVLHFADELYLMGGRTPIDPAIEPVFGASTIWGDVWKSGDGGASWTEIVGPDAPNHWPARAYFEAVAKDGQMFVIGGQDFNILSVPGPTGPISVPVSNFFNDVWSSSDGVNWVQQTADAGWEGRAGLSSIVFGGEIYVMGGSKNDDSAVVGPGGPQRIYFNDVWKSSDNGATWEEVAAEAPWEPRAGAAVVVKDDYLYLLGGEDGFTCDSGGPRCPPYFNDVWRTQDGENWELVTSSADWSARPGHVAVVADDQIVVFGGFGLSTDPTDPFRPSNPIDMWASQDGAAWELLAASPWNAVSPEEIKYDFDALVVNDGPDGAPSIYTFGGDRETFNPFDPVNFLRVDNDVWRFSLVPEPTTFATASLGAVLFFGRKPRRRGLA